MRPWPPILRAVAAQAVAFGLVELLLRTGLMPRAMHGPKLVFLVGILAAGTGRGLKLALGWLPYMLFFPWVVVLVLRHAPPLWVWPVALVALLLVFGGGIRTRVPLYNSNRAAWAGLLALLPEGPVRFADLGAGLGGPLAYLAKARPQGTFHGVEASPLTWLAATLRTLPLRNCRVRLGSLWGEDLGRYDVVYAFLSPAPMPELFQKALREMRPGSLFISNTFAVPGREPQAIHPLPGRADACLMVWRMP